MAINNLDTQVDQAFKQALDNAGAALGAISSALKGAGSDSWDAFNAVHRRATSLPQLGAVVGTQIQAVVDNQATSEEYRRAMGTELREAGTKALQREHRDLIQVDLPALEARLGENSLPTVSNTDPGQQMLRRQEVDGLTAGVNAAGLMARMLELLGQNLEWDRVLCSDYGQMLMVRAGAGADWPAFRKAAIGKLLNSELGSEKQLANRRALRALIQGGLRGHLEAFHQAGRRAIPDAAARSRR